MPRRRVIQRRELLPDPVYNDVVVTQFVNTLMLAGKKSVAEGIIYGAFDLIKEKIGEGPSMVFQKAVENVKPALEIKTRRVGGANYQIPVEINPARRQTLAMRWIIKNARERATEKGMIEQLAGEIMDAYNGRGGAIKKKEDVHKMAEANKAFAHYRW